jgi:hypothetical protein
MSKPLPVVTDEPAPTPFPVVSSEAPDDDKPKSSPLSGAVDRIRRKFTTRHGWLGDYDYAWLAAPS